MVAEEELKTTAYENSQSHSGSFYGADNSNYNSNYYQVVTLTPYFVIFFCWKTYCLTVIWNYTFWSLFFRIQYPLKCSMVFLEFNILEAINSHLILHMEVDIVLLLHTSNPNNLICLFHHRLLRFPNLPRYIFVSCNLIKKEQLLHVWIICMELVLAGQWVWVVPSSFWAKRIWAYILLIIKLH